MTTKDKLTQLFQNQREELKDWLHGTINKQYDREETIQTIREDVDRYFSDEWIAEALAEARREELKKVYKQVLNAHKDSKEIADKKFREGCTLGGDYSTEYAQGVVRGLTIAGRIINSLQEDTV